MIKGYKPYHQGGDPKRGVYMILIDWITGYYATNWFSEDFVDDEVLPSNNDQDSQDSRTFWYRMQRHD